MIYRITILVLLKFENLFPPMHFSLLETDINRMELDMVRTVILKHSIIAFIRQEL